MFLRALLLSAALALAPSPALADTDRTVVADGHVDVGPRVVDGRWTVQISEDEVWRDTTDVVLHAVDAAKVQVPDDPAFGFLGSPGSTAWVLPQVQRDGVVWPGWNTQDPQAGAKITRDVTWRLNGVTGPGKFALFVNGDFGAPKVLFDSARPYPQQTGVERNTHAHGNWAFSAPGTYLLDIELSADDRLTDRALLRVFVGPGDPATAFDAPPPPGFQEETTPTTLADLAEPADDDSPPWPLIGGGAVLVIAIAAAATWALRRRKAAG